MNKNNIENSEKELKEIKQLLAKQTQPELPFEKPKPSAEIIQFKPKPGSPILEWWKTHKDETNNLASVDDIAPFLSQFYSERQLLEMDEKELENVLQDLLEKGVL